MHKLTAIINKTNNNYCGTISEIDGFVATADTMADIQFDLLDGLAFHLEGCAEDGNAQAIKLLEKDYFVKFNYES